MMKIKNDFNVLDYVSLVNDIVAEYFDSDGEYTPHIGKLNVMRLFYNYCVIESDFDIPHDFEDALELNVLIVNDEFMESFNSALKTDGVYRLNFANAYAEAMDIVNTRKGTFGNAIEILKNGMANLIEKISPMFSTDNLEKFSKIADEISNGNFTPDAIVEAYGKSKRLEEVVK